MSATTLTQPSASSVLTSSLALIEADGATVAQLRRAAANLLRHAAAVDAAREASELAAPMAMLGDNLKKVARMLNELAELRDRVNAARRTPDTHFH